MKKRIYKSPVREEGYAGMTIEAIAKRAGVSAQSVYAIFKSKTGVLIELLNESAFTPDYEATVRQAMSAREPETRLRIAARIARQIHDAQSAAFELLRGAGVVAPELAKLEQQREDVRYERQEQMIISLRKEGSLRPGLDYQAARDIFWMFTGDDVYRMLVRERGWSSAKYQEWLGETLVEALLSRG